MLYEIKVPETGFSVTQGTVVKWHFRVGDRVSKDDTVVSVETEKISVEIPAAVSGILSEIRYDVGSLVQVGAVLGCISDDEAEVVLDEAIEKPVSVRRTGEGLEMPEGPSFAQEGRRRSITPLARNVARALNIDLERVAEGIGPKGRITKADVLKFAESMRSDREVEQEKSPVTVMEEASKDGEVIKLTGWRKVIADKMTASWKETPMICQSIVIDVTELTDFISSLKDTKNLPRLTYLPFLMKAVQAGIRITPEVNAYCYPDRFIIQKNLNVGVAIDVQGKLIVPVVKHVHEKSIIQISEELKELIEKARNGKMETKDVQDGTITISNMGVTGIDGGFSMILPPQTAIICAFTVREVPVVINGSIAIRKCMGVSISYDHRAVQGAPGARFSKEFQLRLEDVKSLLLTLR